MEMSPILDMFTMLEFYLPEGYVPQSELDEKSMLKVCLLCYSCRRFRC